MQSNGRTELEQSSTGTELGRCLVDGDAAINSRDRRARGKALGISFAIETAALALLIVAPMVTSIAQPHLTARSVVDLAFGASRTHSPTQHPPTRNRHQSALDPGRLKFITDQATPQPAHNTEVDNDPPILDSGSPLGFSNPDGPLMAGLRPSGAGVLPLAEIKKPEEKRPMKISEPVLQAQLILRIEPRYPPLALQTRREGTVLLHAIISRDGRITALEVVSGSPLFVQAALDAVRQWRYRPTVLNGAPVEVETSIMVIFRLNR